MFLQFVVVAVIAVVVDGPFLFDICINYLPQAVQGSIMSMYAELLPFSLFDSAE